MAIYILAASTDRPLGSRSGATFQRAGVNFVIRHRTVPVQKRTPSQSAVKNRFDHVQKNWTTLSAPQKQTFSDEAINYPRTDSLGNPYTLRGDSLQASTNLNLLSAGSTPVNSIPAPVIFPGWNPGGIGAAITAESVNAAISNNPIPTDFSVLIDFSAPQSTGIINENAHFFQIARYTSGQDQTGNNWWTAWQSIFGNSPELIGKFQTVRIRMISDLTGQADTIQYTSIDITA